MKTLEHRYEVHKETSQEELTYFFVSRGDHKDVVKVIQFAFVQEFDQKRVYNLGFGDYEIDTQTIHDNSITNNGDVYRVFNTVLSTIPQFFESHPQSILLVQGSDGREGFEAECRLHCHRNCGEHCRNFNRRMLTYLAYINRKFELLNVEYQFFGGKDNGRQWFDFEEFAKNKAYDSIMVLRRNA